MTSEISSDSEGDVQELEEAPLSVILESLIFAAEKPLTVKELASLIKTNDVASVREALDDLVIAYQERGIVLDMVAGGYQFRTHPRTSAWVQHLIAGRPIRLSRAQLETLAICAYRQPVTKPEIDEIRGVDSSATLKVLVERQLIRVLGRKEEPGRPLLYGTTREFLEFFQLSDLEELPTLREFQELSDESMEIVRKLGFDKEPGEGEVAPSDSASGDDFANVEVSESADAEQVAGLDDAADSDTDSEADDLADTGRDSEANDVVAADRASEVDDVVAADRASEVDDAVAAAEPSPAEAAEVDGALAMDQNADADEQLPESITADDGEPVGDYGTGELTGSEPGSHGDETDDGLADDGDSDQVSGSDGIDEAPEHN